MAASKKPNLAKYQFGGRAPKAVFLVVVDALGLQFFSYLWTYSKVEETFFSNISSGFQEMSTWRVNEHLKPCANNKHIHVPRTIPYVVFRRDSFLLPSFAVIVSGNST